MESQVKFLFGPKPKVSLVSMTPEFVVALMTRGYTGVYETRISESEERKFWQELGSTKLKAPLEAAQICWLIEDVTRAFTHQIVRYRTAKIVQESLRFSIQVAEGAEVQGNQATVMIPQSVVDGEGNELEEYCQAAESAFFSYWQALEAGVPVQDARGLLPHNVCTRLFFSVDMRTLAHIAEQRFCCQAQGSGQGEAGEWTSVILQMKELLEHAGAYYYASQLRAPWEDPTCTSCGFGASFDRPCSYKKRFDHNLLQLGREAGLISLEDEVNGEAHF